MKTPVASPSPYGLHVIDSCFLCVMKEEGLFCRLPPAVLRDLNSIRQNSLYPPGALLFVEGESPKGLFILCSGQAKLSASSKDGRSVILRTVKPGEIMGLSSVTAKKPFAVTAEIVVPSQVSFIPRQKFSRFLRAHVEVSARVAEHLSMELHRAWEQTRLVTLASSAQGKLAQLLLSWTNEVGQQTPEGVRIRVTMTREEMGESIGASRETVSRLLTDFKRRGLISANGSSMFILKPDDLQKLCAS
jgi:CRP/FNR family cyclic AMP-dependent transcriptional regulator